MIEVPFCHEDRKMQQQRTSLCLREAAVAVEVLLSKVLGGSLNSLLTIGRVVTDRELRPSQLVSHSAIASLASTRKSLRIAAAVLDCLVVVNVVVVVVVDNSSYRLISWFHANDQGCLLLLLLLLLWWWLLLRHCSGLLIGWLEETTITATTTTTTTTDNAQDVVVVAVEVRTLRLSNFEKPLLSSNWAKADAFRVGEAFAVEVKSYATK